MLVQQSEMFGGFFSTFGMQANLISYQLPDGTWNFSGAPAASGGAPVNINSPLLITEQRGKFSAAANVAIYIPTHYRSISSGGSACPQRQLESDSANLALLGFFGPGVTEQRTSCAFRIRRLRCQFNLARNLRIRFCHNQLMTWTSAPITVATGSSYGLAPLTGGQA